MVQQAPLRSSFLFSLLCMLGSCVGPVPQAAENQEVVNSTNVNFTMMNGLLQKGAQPFTGTVFTLFPHTNDTAELKNYYRGREHGIWRKFYENGSKKEIRYFLHGKKNGGYITWWENGNKQLHYYFEDDEYEGNCKEWNADGVLTKDMHYKRSKEDGSQQWWYDNGKIRANYVVKDGRRYGLLGTKNCMNVSDSIFEN